MKTKSLLKAAAISAMFMMMGWSANAQNVAAPTNANAEQPNSDYVTIGSRIPYFAAPDAAIQAMTTAGNMKESIFQWIITDAVNSAIAGVPLLEYDGTAGQQYNAFRVVTPATGFYDNEISLVWSAPTFTVGTPYKVQVAEQSVTNSATIAGCLDATPETKDVFVLARPTALFDGTEGGGCSVAPGSTYYVPLRITGLGKWTVTYTVSYNGGAASAPADYNLTIADPIGGVNDGNVVAESILSRSAAGTPTTGTDGLAIVLPAAQYGFYDVTITNVSDRISRKSLDPLAAVATAGTYRIYVNPVPVTSPIQHIKNNL